MPASESPTRLTPARARALAILHPVHALDAQLFAHYMWPASPSWRARNPGRGAYLKARSFLARLEREGLVVGDRTRDGPAYRVTPEGERLALRAHRPVGVREPARVRSAPPKAS